MIVVHKAAVCVLRATGREPELLVFEHPTAGLQLPKGGVEPGEDPATAALRELAEESGITHARLVEALPPHTFVGDGLRQVWHSWVAVADGLPERWEHVASGNSEEYGLVFCYRWIPVEEAPRLLDHPSFAPLAAAVSRCAWVANRLWGNKASLWEARTGADGDLNRQINSDPVLWQLLGPIRGQRVLDAGCGTGYLAAKLAEAGAEVVAVDNVPEMVELARRRASRADVRLDDVQSLASLPDAAFDAVVSNYVLMDLPDLEAACAALRRVLRPGGRAVLVVSHPCFTSAHRADDHTIVWEAGYFERGARSDRWGEFETRFVFWHRTLADYLRAFTAAGLALEAFEEPIVGPDADFDPAHLKRFRMFPYSFVVRLRRPAASGPEPAAGR